LQIEPSQQLTVAPLEGKRWRPTVVVPRALCVFESMPCAGLAWHEHRMFARAQAARLAPFKQYGCNAAVAGGRLMLWFWDQAEVSAALSAGGLNPLSQIYVAESLLRRPAARDGSVNTACWGGTDRIEVAQGALLQSVWEAGPATSVSIAPIAMRTWARELLSHASLRPSWFGRLGHLATRRTMLPLFSASILTLTAAYLTYWGGSYLGSTQRLTQLEMAADDADRAIGNLVTLKQSAALNERWVTNYTQLAASVELDRLLSALTVVMEHHGVVIRELELRKGELRLALSSAGGEIDLPRLLEGLTRMPGVSDVQLRDNVELAQVGFSLRVPAYFAVLTPYSIPAPQESDAQK
jgi:hypothetical protein